MSQNIIVFVFFVFGMFMVFDAYRIEVTERKIKEINARITQLEKANSRKEQA